MKMSDYKGVMSLIHFHCKDGEVGKSVCASMCDRERDRLLGAAVRLIKTLQLFRYYFTFRYDCII